MSCGGVQSWTSSSPPSHMVYSSTLNNYQKLFQNDIVVGYRQRGKDSRRGYVRLEVPRIVACCKAPFSSASSPSSPSSSILPEGTLQDTIKNRSALTKYRVAELREFCRTVGLSEQGTKPVLVERLWEHIARSGNTTRVENLETIDYEHVKEVDDTNVIVEEEGDETLSSKTLYVTWLGTSSGAPTSRRNVSSMALRLDEENVLLVDCGEGTRNQLRTANIDPGHVSHIFITHLHGDHCFGIAGGLGAIMNARRGTPREKEPIYIYGPPELHRLVAASCKAAQMKFSVPVVVTGWVLDPSRQKNPVAVPGESLLQIALQGPDQRVHPKKAQEVQKKYDSGSDQVVQHGLTWSVPLKDFGINVTSAQLQHRMPCWGYVFEESHSGDEYAPRKIVLLGDTCNSEAIAKAAMDCDLLSHEATYKNGMEEKARIATHSTSSQAGSFARRVNAKALVLTHFSARYDQVDKYKKMWTSAREKGMTVGEMQSSSVSILQEEAKAEAGDQCRVYLANDFYTFRLSPKKKIYQ